MAKDKQTGFEKMSGKMFDGGVKVAQPVAGGARMTEEQRRAIVAAAVEGGRVESVQPPVAPVSQPEPAGVAGGEPKGAGRPKVEPRDLKPLNFKVSADFHRKVKLLSADSGRPIVDLLYEAFGDLFVKMGVKD